MHPSITPQQETSQASARSWRRPTWMRPGLLWFAFDLLVPTALFYVLIWWGTSLYVALLASAAFSAITALISYTRGTGGQRFAPFMLALTLVSFGISLVTGSDRFLLARESLLTAMVGCWFIGSIWTSRPLAYVFTRPLMEGGWGRRWKIPDISWELIWEQDSRFRHIWRVSTVMWGIATLIDAVLRVVMAYTLPINSVPVMHLGMFIVTGLVMQVVTNIYYARAGLWKLIWEAAMRNNTDRPSLAPAS